MLNFVVKYEQMSQSDSIENFIKNIYALKNDEGERVSVSALADRLKVSRPAISDMAKKLDAKEMVIYTPYKELELTSKGEELALRVIRRHRLWELFLHQVLGLDLKEVHEEAERLEHQTSDALMKHLNNYLGNPKFDPHGDPIPAEDGSMNYRENTSSLQGFNIGDHLEIVRLIYGDGDLQEFFERNGILPKAKLSVLSKFKMDGSIELIKEGRTIVIPTSIQKRIICLKIEKI